ncbi:TRAP transporter substrate-binding protein DctP [Bacillus sp. FJAT-45350]|uniref:TRAP transporter substrate-binding protein DctP n=1 Tax=Bacillus sp. FJAT-45350 TaxID=2011014 RepID=UPI00359C9D1E
MKRHLIKVLGTAVIGMMALTGCGGSDDASTAPAGEGQDPVENTGEEFVIKIGHIGPPTHSYTLGIEALAEAIEEETNGQVKFEIYPGGQLGGERDMVEQVQLGSLDMGVYTSAPASNFVKELAVLDLPMIFRNHQHAYDTLDGEVGQELLGLIDNAGFKGLAFWENGMRHVITNGVQVRSAEDIKGMKMRAIENDLVLETYRALGSDPTPIAWPEVHTSLQQGVVDGLDNAYGVIHSTGIYEVQEYLSEVGLYYAAAVLIMNEDKFNSLPADIQEVFVRLGQEYAHVQRKMTTDDEEKQKAELVVLEDGLEILEFDEVDVESFREAVQPVYDKFGSQFGDLVERIQAVE